MSSRSLHVLVLMGGPSSEHEVSLDSGRRVVEGLRGTAHRVRPVVVGRGGRWRLDVMPEAAGSEVGSGDGATGGETLGISVGEALARLRSASPDVVFLALHGEFGEDGTIQALLDAAELPYTGSGILGSALAMDKVRSRWIFQHHGIRVPAGKSLSAAAWHDDRHAVTQAVARALPPPPWFVKPADRGSSVGISVAAETKGLGDAVDDALRYSDWVLVEEYVAGDEVTCGVLDDPDGGPAEALPPTQIIPREDEFFDYHAKYTPGATDEITPARVADAVGDQIRRTALGVHDLLHLEGMSRTDMIVRNGIPHVLEANTIPGLTDTSLLPQAAAAAGISFSDLLDRLVRHAVRRGPRRLR